MAADSKEAFRIVVSVRRPLASHESAWPGTLSRVEATGTARRLRIAYTPAAPASTRVTSLHMSSDINWYYFRKG